MIAKICDDAWLYGLMPGPHNRNMFTNKIKSVFNLENAHQLLYIIDIKTPVWNGVESEK